MLSKLSYTAPRVSLIGRDEEIEVITNVIGKRRGSAFCIYVYGQAGLGKTRLLEHVESIVIEFDRLHDEMLCGDIIDLYHPLSLNPLGIEEILVDSLNDENHYFEKYHRLRKEYNKAEQRGLEGGSLARLQQEVENAFRIDYQSLADDFRIILRFDTVELLQYEVDRPQEICGDSNFQSSRDRLLDTISRLPNTMVVFAGRPDAKRELKAELEKRFDSRFRELKLKRLSEDDTIAYVQQVSERGPKELANASKYLKQIYNLSKGQPVYIGIAIELVLNGLPIEELSTLSVDNARGSEEIVKQLIDTADNPEVSSFLRELAYAPMGMSAELFGLLAGISKSRAQFILDEVKEYSFIKSREVESTVDSSGESVTELRLYYHDALYDIFEYYFHSIQEAQEVYARIRDYYREKRRKLAERLRLIPDDAPSDDGIERQALLSLLQAVTLDLLHYELQADPLFGYFHAYDRWELEAVLGYQVEYGLRLRQITTRFAARYLREKSRIRTERSDWLRSQIDLDVFDRLCALRWVRRHLASGRANEALALTEKLKQSKEGFLRWDEIDDPFYQAELQIISGETRLFIGGSLDDESFLQVTQAGMQQLQELSDSLDELRNQSWRYRRLMGRAEYNIGYYFRLKKLLSLASEHYQAALIHYRDIDLPGEMAATTRNQAFVLALLGAIDNASDLARDSVQIFRRLGLVYQQGYAWNTLGRVYIEADKPREALLACRRARNLFGGIAPGEDSGGLSRGIAFADIAIGNALRMCGNQVFDDLIGVSESEGHYEEAEIHLRSAISLLGEDPTVVSAHAELGRLYRDRLHMYQRIRPLPDDYERQRDIAAANLELTARRKAIEFDMTEDEVDLLEDIARFYWYLGQDETAQRLLDEAESKVDPSYRVISPPSSDKSPNKGDKPAVDMYRLALGKIHLLRAQIGFKQLDQLRIEYPKPQSPEHKELLYYSVKQHILAMVYFEAYSPYPTGLSRLRRNRSATYYHLRRYGRETLEDVLAYANTLVNELGLGKDGDANYHRYIENLDYLRRALGVSEEIIEL